MVQCWGKTGVRQGGTESARSGDEVQWRINGEQRTIRQSKKSCGRGVGSKPGGNGAEQDWLRIVELLWTGVKQQGEEQGQGACSRNRTGCSAKTTCLAGTGTLRNKGCVRWREAVDCCNLQGGGSEDGLVVVCRAGLVVGEEQQHRGASEGEDDGDAGWPGTAQ